MLHVERLDPCTPHDCGQYSQYLVLAASTNLTKPRLRLQVETLDLCTDMRAIVRAHIVVGLLGSHLQARLRAHSAKPATPWAARNRSTTNQRLA